MAGAKAAPPYLFLTIVNKFRTGLTFFTSRGAMMAGSRHVCRRTGVQG
jgi:hypothetical protein